MRSAAVCAALAALCVSRAPAVAEEGLLSYLRPLTVDAAALPLDAPPEGGVALAADAPVGQTFQVSPDIDAVAAVEIGLYPLSGAAPTDAAVTLTLWDAPDKGTRLAFDTRRLRPRPVFRLDARIEGGRTYYWELTAAGDGKPIAVLPKVQSYDAGQAYLRGSPQEYDVPFRVLFRPPLPKPEQAFSRLLALFDPSIPPVARALSAAAEGSLDQAVADAAAAVRGAVGRIEAHAAPEYDRAPADTVVAGLSQGGAPEDDWSDLALLVDAYSRTGDDEYRRALASAVSGLLPQMPPPDVGALSGAWSEQAILGRLSAGPKVAGALFGFPDAEVMVAAHLATCADVLASKLQAGAADETAARALADFASAGSIYAGRADWARSALHAAARWARSAALADGSPASGNAQALADSCTTLVDLLEKAAPLDVHLPEADAQLLDRMLDFCSLAAAPDGSIPAIGNSPRVPVRSLLRKAADVLGRADLLYIASACASGTPPKITSAAFTDGGWYCMRAQWPADPETFAAMPYAMLRGDGGGCGLLSMVLGYGGRMLVVDPGPQRRKSEGLTIEHSTLTVDGAEQEPRGEVCVRAVALLPSADFLDLSAETYPGVIHRRSVIYLKPDIWIVRDLATVEAEAPPAPEGASPPQAAAPPAPAGERVFTQTWHLADGADPQQGERLLVRTRFPDGGNLALLPLLPERVSCSVGGAVVQYSVRGTASGEVATLLVPFSGEGLPAIQASASKADSGGGLLISIATPRGSHRVVLGTGPDSAASFDNGSLKLQGVAADVSGAGPERFCLVHGRRLEAGGVVLAEADEPISALQVVYDDESVNVVVEGGHPSLRVATLGRTKLVVPGGLVYDIPATQEHVSPVAP